MSDEHEHQPEDVIRFAGAVWTRENDLAFTFARASGPGGQAVNKLSTAAQLRIRIADIRGLNGHTAARLRRLAGRRLTKDDEIMIESKTHRSQLDNRRACIERLRDLVVHAVTPPKPRKPTRPTRGSIERRLDAKKQRSDKKGQRRWRPD